MNIYEETKFIMKKYGITANKKLGQNFLIDDNAIDAIVSSSEISKEDLVIEIGPGLGTLTKPLLESAGKVICIELDTRMIEILEDRFKLYDNFELINNDVLKVDLNKLISVNKNGTIKHAKVVANLPYYITTPIIMKLLEERLDIETITVMIQKEVADRLVAKPGEANTGAITYAINYYTEPSRIYEVNKTSFIPAPEVNSTIIKLEVLKTPSVEIENEELMFKIIKAAFMQKRKTLLNGLTNSNLFGNKEEIEKMLQEIGIDLKIRGEKLTLEEYAQIAKYLNKKD
ncbi:MAG: 16S rRNA (adenine(1518)-N(6)/adenine(1519)-N(6))-dimethyltransferase RsmA [Clostridia bacterium]